MIERMREKERQEEELSFTECLTSIIDETEAAFKEAVNGRNEFVNVNMEITQAVPIETVVTDWEIKDFEVREFIRSIGLDHNYCSQN